MPVISDDVKTLVGNLSTTIREESLEGVPHVVAPAIMIVEGVHNGSGGPLYYPSEELSKFPAAWDHKPVVLYHPEMEGVPVSACSREVIERHKLGILLNTRFEDGKLKTEVWLNKRKTSKIAPEILHSLSQGRVLEVSTGVFVDEEAVSGIWNEEEYKAIARNYRPDHLAILPDMVGACSVEDGAGFPRLNQGWKKSLMGFLCNLVGWRGYASSDILQDNEESFGSISRQIFDELAKAFPGDSLTWWVEDIFDGKFVYGVEGKETLFQRDYLLNEQGVVSLGDEILPVVRKTEYFPVKNNQQEVDKNNQQEVESMNEELKEILNQMGVKLETLESKISQGPQDSQESPEVLESSQKEPENLEQFLETVPEKFRESIEAGIQVYMQQKKDIVDELTANEKCPFSLEDLNFKTLEELTKLKALSQIAQQKEENTSQSPSNRVSVNFAGQAVAPQTNESHEEEPLLVPAMSFGEEK